MITADGLKWIAEKLGIPTLFCTILCFAIYRTAGWFADHVATPMVDQHIEFLKTEQDSMKSIAGDLTKQTDELTKQSQYLRDIRNDQRKFPAVAETMK